MRSESFSSSARTALVLAYTWAKRMGHSCIGSEHLLLGIACEGTGRACKALLDMGITGEKITAAIEEKLGSGKSDRRTVPWPEKYCVCNLVGIYFHDSRDRNCWRPI